MKRISKRQQRERRQRLQGYAVIIASLVGMAAMFGGAYAGDKARGISVGESLEAWGL